MDIFKIVAIVAACVIALSTFVDFKGLYTKMFTKSTTSAPVPVNISVGLPTISQIVEQWDKLKGMCIQAGSTHSADELDNVFLALLDKTPRDNKTA